ncbi:MAG: DUF5685 family protein [Aureispira sp.]
MFGLMRPKHQCSTHSQENSTYLLHRQHYCGTCKAIGKTFDHKSRLMLNFDTVFLAELLSELENTSPETWEANLQVVNTCFAMPKEEEVPFSLEYAAHASALLGALKIDDNIKDSGRFYWPIIRQAYRKTFQKAYQQFSDWGLDTLSINQWILKQVQLEQEATVFTADLKQHLLDYAAPTAQITSALFGLGGQLLENKATLEALGLAFGQLMYILDAFEDYEKDVFSGEFNPLALYWKEKRSLPESALESIRQLLWTLEETITLQIQQLPIAQEAKERFTARLSSNLALRLYRERVIPKTLKERLALRWQKAKETAEQFTCQPTTWSRQINFYMIAVAVFINPEAQSYLPEEGKWEIFQWGVFFTTFLATLGLVPIVRKRHKEKRKARREKRRQKRLRKRLLKKLSPSSLHNTCWADCCNACCSGCCEDCCQTCSDSGCCESCCESMCDEDDNDLCLIFTLIFLGLCLLAGLVVLILFLAGVL